MYFDVKGEIKLTANETYSKSKVRGNIVDALTPIAAKVYLPNDSDVEFAGPRWACSDLHLLLPVNYGSITVEEAGSLVYVIKYRISLSGLRSFCALLNIVAIIFISFKQRIGDISWWQVILILTLMIWGWLYGMNWVIFSLRFRSFLNRAASKGLKH